MNNNVNNIPVIKKRKRKRKLTDFPLKDLQKLPLVNPLEFYRENLAEDFQGMYFQGYIQGITKMRRLTGKRIKNPLSSPSKDPLGNWKEDLPGVETKKDHFVLGFTTAIYHYLNNKL